MFIIKRYNFGAIIFRSEIDLNSINTSIIFLFYFMDGWVFFNQAYDESRKTELFFFFLILGNKERRRSTTSE